MKPVTLRKHFIESLYDTLEGVISPTPYLSISEGDNVDVKFLDGKGLLPMPGTTEITVLDLDIASLFFDDFHLLYEGVTGVGKTYTSDALFNTLFGPNGHYTLRLSGGVLGSSALEPFTTTTLENGVPKTRIDQDKCEQYAGLFIDEINRGDSNELFQVVDSVIHVNGDTGYLRLPIPGTARYKGLAIIAAMNPSDAMHSAAIELDIAGENRFLKFKFPNGVSEAGSSQLEKKLAGDLHESFWSEFKKRTKQEGGWRDLYPVVTDSAQFSNELIGDTREFLDCALGYVGYNPKITYERNLELINQGGLKPVFSVRDDNELEVVLESQGKLKHGFVRRDLQKINDLSRLISFIKGVKNGSYEVNVDLNDVAASIGIVLESKTVTGVDYGDLMKLVNDARKAYCELREQVKAPNGFGYRQLVLQSALSTNSFDDYVNVLDKGINQLNTQVGGVASNTIKSRLMADLVVLKHFSKTYEEGVTKALGSKDSFKAFNELYNKYKSKGSVYEHRLDSIV